MNYIAAKLVGIMNLPVSNLGNHELREMAKRTTNECFPLYWRRVNN